ncbi:MAG: acetyl-CoA carboxylase biotin carboxyl carrier protein [Candidatus Neomarinimicrobiota bacterium]|nr:acetyl-CoA carboxylase biotin carboxyl carrier protein [Candidatus Neomarinimicrobiota bacterium]
MWQDKLKEIIYILENSDVNEIEVTFWGKKFRVLKNSPNVTTSSPNKAINTKNSQSSSSDNLENQNLDEEIKISILSPMPGVFYSSQSPDKPTYVKEGDTIKSGQVLCIIESMKIMNEIESEHNGVIKRILVNNSDPVEFNQPLYVIEPS